FLFVGQSHDAKGKNFVDLGSVEQVASALRSDLGIVVKNDGRRKQRVALSFRSDQHGIGANVLAAGRERAQLVGRIEQRNKLTGATLHTENGMGRDQRAQQCVFPARQ